jgi:eukaryotic-like serine/threonine-protein kinase
LEKNPRRRFGSAQDLAKDLNRYLTRKPIVSRRVGVGERVWLWCRRKPVAAGLCSAVVLAVIAGLFGLASVMRGRVIARELAREQELAFRRKFDFWISQVQGAWDNYD